MPPRVQTGSKASQGYRAVTITGLLLLAFVLACRFSQGVADFYSCHLYPAISATLSWLSSGVPFSVQDIALMLLVGTFIGTIAVALVRRWSIGRCLRHECTLVLWTFVWFYMAWCANYFRSSLFDRTGTRPLAYQEQSFKAFAQGFVLRINEEWTDSVAIDQVELEKDIKGYYSCVPDRYGLAMPRSWQHPKYTFFNRIYSSVGIQGFMEPLFSESCLNQDLPLIDHPFVYAHEYAHLLGVSSEAECNWWAFHACMASSHQAVRYSGLKGILSHLLNNAGSLLTREDYLELFASIRPEVQADMKQTSQHWQRLLSPTLRRIHTETYDAFLRSNTIASGMQNYSEVIGMLMSVEAPSGGE